jgi:hypothetical protein
MKHDAKDQLVDELLTGEELEAFRQTSLRHGLALIKSRRRRRNMGRISAMALLTFLVVLGLWTNRQAIQPLPTASISVRPTSASVSKVRLINDDDLLTLFPNRPLAMVGSAGHRKLVFLDQPANGQ